MVRGKISVVFSDFPVKFIHAQYMRGERSDFGLFLDIEYECWVGHEHTFIDTIGANCLDAADNWYMSEKSRSISNACFFSKYTNDDI